MSESSDALEVLTTAATEMEAVMIVGALKSAGVEATSEGGLTAGFRAEAPGVARVMVHRDALDRARELLEQYRKSVSEIDWSQVDVGEPEGAADPTPCPQCGYDVRASADRCPECGALI